MIEAMVPGSHYLKSALYLNTVQNSNISADAGGASIRDYIPRPTTNAMKLAVVFNSTTASITILVLPSDMKFPIMLSVKRAWHWLSSEKWISSVSVN